MSNGRSGSSRTIPTDLAAIKDIAGHPKRMALARCGRHASFDEFSLGPPRPNMARYGRQSSFAGSYCIPNSSNSNSASCSRQNSRAGDNSGVRSPMEIKRSLDGEKRNSGEGRRLLDTGDRTSTFMIEEEKSPGGLALANCLRRAEQDKIAAEMEKLLSEDAITTPGDQKICPPAGDTINTESEHKNDLERKEKSTANNSPEYQNNNNMGREASEVGEPQPETSTTASGDSEDSLCKHNGARNAITSRENGKSVQFCDSLSAKVSVV